jgi:serine/threonine-protein kinase
VSLAGPVLKTLATGIGRVPQLLLPDTAGGATDQPLCNPASPETPTPAEQQVRVQLLGEIARGGMGAVFKGRDPDLGRDLAVKVLLEAHMEKPELVRRFVEEAQIGGQLQHPGVVPVYELGAFGDRRPYFTMKLVKGQTLAELLAERDSPAHDLPRFLAIFEQVCQTMAYAHARKVIHRDLKPSNVMVGSFGEVQVMDWGLAKVLPQGGVVDHAPAKKIDVHQTVIATDRVGTDSDLSQTGSVLGTPAYMAPEQARGEIEQIGERADVFALGSILCDVLTGQPAFVGRSAGEIHRKAALGDLAEAAAALEASGADAELIALARDCLAREAEDRPRHAGVVAERITAYRADVQDRLRTAEIARAAEQARAEESRRTAEVAEAKAKAERQARRMTGALAAAMLALVVAGGGGYAWLQRQRAERRSRVDLALREAEVFRDEAKRAGDDLARWGKARDAAHTVDRLLADASDEPTRKRVAALVESVTAEAKTAENDQTLLDKLIDIRLAKSDDRDGSATEAIYAAAFREAGLDVLSRPPAEVGAEIKSRAAAVCVALAAALDDWAALRRNERRDRAGAQRLVEAARIADADPWRGRLRAALDASKGEKRLDALRGLARSAKIDELPAVSLDLLGSALRDSGDPKLAESVLRQAQRRHPGDVWLNYNLAWCLEKLARPEEAIRYYTAVRSIRPDAAHDLAHVLEKQRELGEAIAVLQELTRLRPGNGRHLLCLSRALQKAGQTQEAKDALSAAFVALRDEVLRNPGDPWAHFSLGSALADQGNLDAAIAEYREVIRINPEHHVHGSLADALASQGKREEAIAEYRAAIRIEPDAHSNYEHLADVLQQVGRQEEAFAEYRIAIKTDPNCSFSRNALAWGVIVSAIRPRSEYDEAVAHARKAVELAPQNATIVNTLALAEYRVGRWDESINASKRSMELSNGGGPSDWFFLALAHGKKGAGDEARKWFDKAVAWTKEKDPKNSELRQFWKEAAELVGRPGPDASGQSPSRKPDREKRS